MSSISTTEDHSENESENLEQNNPEIVSPDLPKSKLTEMFHQVEMMALSKGNKNSLDFSSMNEKQIDKLIDLMAQNENNAFNYHTKKLETVKEIKLSEHNNSSITEKTDRYTILSIIVGTVLISLIILIFKETFFDKWLTFITGMGAGFGLGKFGKPPKKPSSIKEFEKDDEAE